ncbi:MAG TPA: hypothetical protein VL551_22500, partial [Actinospica sp.]|nr:hypothetical protein [Actinospica sp.]
MAETPAQTLRRAAEKLRAVANDALRDIPMNEYWEARHHPDCTEDELYRAGVENGLGGPAGVLAGACTPGVMLLVADWLDAEAGAHEGGMGASETLRDMFAEAG